MKQIFNAFKVLSLLLIFVFSNQLVAQEEGEEEGKSKGNPKKERKEIRKNVRKGLKELYKLNPEAEAELANAYGYAVFGNTGVNLLLLSTARGGGLAHNNVTGEDTYMKVFSGGVGVGLGVKKFFAIFIFDNEKVFNNFVESGWAAETQADAAAKSDTQGAAASLAIPVAPGIRLYQITDVGIAAQATIQGTKYYKDKDLN